MARAGRTARRTPRNPRRGLSGTASALAPCRGRRIGCQDGSLLWGRGPRRCGPRNLRGATPCRPRIPAGKRSDDDVRPPLPDRCEPHGRPLRRPRASPHAEHRPAHRHHRLFGGRRAHGHRPDRGRIRRLDDPALVPAARRHRFGRGPRGRRLGVPRRPRHPHDRRRLDARPLLRAGVRAGARPVLGDGLPPARHERAPRRALRRVAAADRRVLAHARLAARRRTRGAGAGCHDSRLLRGLRRRGQRLPRRPPGRRCVARIRGDGAAERRLRDRTVDPGRLGGVAQGDGVGPAQQHRRRDRSRAARRGLHPRPDRRPLPRVPLRGPPRDRADDHGRCAVGGGVGCLGERRGGGHPRRQRRQHRERRRGDGRVVA